MILAVVIQQILQFCQESYGSSNPPPIGTGIMWCIILYVMQVASTIFMQQYFQLSAITGLMCRTVLISSIYQKSMVLSGKARMVSTWQLLVAGSYSSLGPCLPLTSYIVTELYNGQDHQSHVNRHYTYWLYMWIFPYYLGSASRNFDWIGIAHPQLGCIRLGRFCHYGKKTAVDGIITMSQHLNS